MINDLKKFLLRGNVVDLAVAVVIGAAFKTVVDALVANIVNPLIAAVFGEPDVSQVLTFVLRDAEGPDDLPTILSIGGFLQAVLNFVIVGTALFVVVKSFEALQERRAKGETEPETEPTPSDEVVLLTEIRDALRAQGSVSD